MKNKVLKGILFIVGFGGIGFIVGYFLVNKLLGIL